MDQEGERGHIQSDTTELRGSSNGSRSETEARPTFDQHTPQRFSKQDTKNEARIATYFIPVIRICWRAIQVLSFLTYEKLRPKILVFFFGAFLRKERYGQISSNENHSKNNEVRRMIA